MCFLKQSLKQAVEDISQELLDFPRTVFMWCCDLIKPEMLLVKHLVDLFVTGELLGSSSLVLRR